MREPLIAGYVETLEAIIGCPHCHAIYGIELTSRKEYEALSRSLVCRSCFRRFIKPRIAGWYAHPSGVPFEGNSRPIADRGQGETRGDGSQSPGAGRTGVLESALINGAARFGQALRSALTDDGIETEKYRRRDLST